MDMTGDFLESSLQPLSVVLAVCVVQFLISRIQGVTRRKQALEEEHRTSQCHQEKVDNYARQMLETTCYNLWDMSQIAEGVRTDDALALAQALKSNCTVEQLCLMNFNIGPDGACAIASALKYNNTLKYLDLRGANIGRKGSQAVAEALHFNRSLMYLSGVKLNEFATNVFGLPESYTYETSDYIMKAISCKRRREYVRLRYEFLVLRALKRDHRLLDRPCLKDNTLGIAVMMTLSLTDLPFRHILMYLSC